MFTLICWENDMLQAFLSFLMAIVVFIIASS